MSEDRDVASTSARLGKAVTYGPEPQECEAAVIWLHGFGDVPEGWASALGPLRHATNGQWRWLFLRAPPVPQPCYNHQKIPGWGQFHSVDAVTVGNVDYEDEDVLGFYRQSVLAVHRILEELEVAGVPSAKIVVGGFSQGAALALEVCLTYPRRLGGCVSIAGWLSTRARAAIATAPRASKPPFLLCHGTEDDMVGYDCSQAACKAMKEADILVTFLTNPGIKHQSCPEQLRALTRFLHAVVLGPDAPPLEVPDWEEDGEEGEESPEESSDSDVPVVQPPPRKRRRRVQKRGI